MSMSTRRQAEQGRQRVRHRLRRLHRWLGIAVAAFLLLLSVTGIALNHADGWRLDRHYVGWPWLLDAYGIHAPEPSASFADLGYRATLLAGTLYFEGKPVQDGLSELTGLVAIGPMAVAGLSDGVLVMTISGDIVERIDLSSRLAGPIRRLGRSDDAVIIDSNGRLLVSDPEVTGFTPAGVAFSPESLVWPRPTQPSDAELETLNRQYRGRGLTVERLLADIHSGRVVGIAGPLLMDALAILLIVLSISGLILWARNGGRENGSGGYRGPRSRPAAASRGVDKRTRRTAE